MAAILTAEQVVQALARKHSKDVFVPECKNGATWNTQHRRMDAWVMPRSWAKPWVTAYEVKVTRADWHQDDKWPAYLPLCNIFYFACPWGLLDPAEMPAEVGLRWVTSTGNRVITKKRAPLRQDVVIPEEVWRYILMFRAQIVPDWYRGPEPGSEDNRRYWRAWLAQKAKDRDMGYRVSRQVAAGYARMEVRQNLAEAVVRGYETIRARLVELGFDPDKPLSTWGVDRRLEELRQVVPHDLEWAVDRGLAGLQELQDALRKLKKEEEADHD